jgi:acyl carrier protein
MTKQDLFNNVKGILLNKMQITKDPSLISADTDLIKTFGMDSMKLMKFIVELENTFNFIIDSDEISYETVTQIDKLLDFLTANIPCASGEVR